MMRTILHGQCLLNGKHAPGSRYHSECPLHTAAARSERARKAAGIRWGGRGGGGEHQARSRQRVEPNNTQGPPAA